MSKCDTFRITREAPVAVVRPSEMPLCDASSCETIIQLGIFFDGTGNNKKKDIPRGALSNIVKLHDAYMADPDRGIAKTYIEGLGTACVDLNEPGESVFGGGFGSGGEGRLLLALCSVMNNLYESVLKKKWASNPAVQDICRPSNFFGNNTANLEKFGLAAPLNGSKLAVKVSFFKKEGQNLQQQLADIKGPVVKEIIFDIFGFSRGAAEARVFCHWLSKIAAGGKIAGIPICFRFLGLMDTVASVGVWEGATNAAFNKTGGHTDWALHEHLLVLPQVKNCIHMVAMHEIRKNFPLDQVAVGDVMPENCHEFAYPGSHSDVGGGYAPGALGLAGGTSLQEGDSRKLSQLPLNHMFDCAVAGGVPLSRELTGKKGKNLFDISPVVEAAFAKFVHLSPHGNQRLSDWMLPYLIWRWKSRNEYSSLGHVRNAKGNDLAYLMAAHKQFIQDSQSMEFRGDEEKSVAFVKAARAQDHSCWSHSDYNQPEIGALDREAWEVKKRVTEAKPNPPDLDDFFDNFVHDSLAGFKEKLTEPTGHWRYRRTFRGGDQPLLT